jgi:D-alanyl-lipoteichoic acid acyltransferase DltB (MBOAT superfamily)
MAWGLFQKLFVADNLAGLVSSVYATGAAPTGAEIWLATMAFAFQIYGDFAGYSNLARGMSKLMGIELNVNFRFPYFVTSPQEFWRHWHISLSTWLRDYLYIPLGGNRGSSWETSRNLMITMVLGGLWHGAAWTFVLWGVYQGLALGIGRTVAGGARSMTFSWRRAVGAVVMFQVTCYGWLIFRAESAAQIRDLTMRLFTDWSLPAMALRTLVMPLVLIVTPLLIVHAYQARHDDELAIAQLPWPVRYGFGGLLAYLILLFGNFEGAQFIYFQF